MHTKSQGKAERNSPGAQLRTLQGYSPKDAALVTSTDVVY